ncbi:MAG: DUF4390 domain-containing protein [Sulfurimicrobium sp.]|nr:DUF4390 domain-containing protein [Sulfurimicrobium sp.]MDP1898741.1 DUF4390 domain-containing protein [Sulfurimicrobium sp.]MDP2963660.1 DUF4390 domain-containing protein [Sulfurimicrobium sp.]
MLLFCMAASVRAETGIQVKTAELDMVDEVYQLKADFEVNFSQAVEDALNKGVPLNFVVEFELNRPRWYWLDENISSVQRQLRISYHALTKQYRLLQNEQQKSFASLAELKSELGHIQEWRVVERAQLRKRYLYEARLRMKLDASQLPKPLQVNALASKDWSLESEWFQWVLAP